jgi:RNA polymerase sigma-70 factor, ECF subfamily
MSTQGVTDLLIKLSNGKRDVVDELLPIIYDELKRIAANYLRRERSDHTLQPTALVNEAYMKMIDITQVSWQNKAHFVGVAANQMRRILVDHARNHNAQKRGGEFHIMTLNEEIDKADEQSAELIALDDALTELAKLDPIKAKIVELRYFGGLSTDETAEVLDVAPITVKRHWKMAKAWLYGELSK